MTPDAPSLSAETCRQVGLDRAAALDAALAGVYRDGPHRTWAEAFTNGGPLRGLALAGLPESWRETLAWAGVPLTDAGALPWADHCAVDAALAGPVERDGRLRLPTSERLEQLSGVELVPLRRWVVRHLGVRLQTAPGVRLWLWADRAVLVSRRSEPVGGFLYAPTLEHRTSIMLEPGGWQLIRWG